MTLTKTAVLQEVLNVILKRKSGVQELALCTVTGRIYELKIGKHYFCNPAAFI